MSRSRTILARYVGLCLLFVSPIAAADPATNIVDAAKLGNTTEVARLLDQGANPNEPASDGATALHWAANLNDFKAATGLLKAGAKPDGANRFGVTPAMLAATNGNEKILALLLDAGADPNQATPGGETPLMIAARTGIPKAVRALIDNGANPNAIETWRGQTALMWAAAEGQHEAVQVLLDAGAKRDARSKSGFTAFLFAVRQGHAQVVQTLLDAGADPGQYLISQRGGENPDDDDDDYDDEEDEVRKPRPRASALGLAVANVHYELAAQLLDAGADPNFMWQGRTVLHTITWIRKPGVGSNNPSPPGSGEMTSLELVKDLVDHGADINAQMTVSRAGVRTIFNMQGATPFLLAARTADAELMRLLHELGADPLTPNEDNTTPLLAAAGVGVQSTDEDPGTPAEIYEAVKVALELGADPNTIDTNGETAMHGAAYKYAASTVPLLMQHGMKIETWNRKNEIGWTPLRIATGVHKGMNLRESPETAAEIRTILIAAGLSTYVEPETNISGATD